MKIIKKSIAVLCIGLCGLCLWGGAVTPVTAQTARYFGGSFDGHSLQATAVITLSGSASSYTFTEGRYYGGSGGGGDLFATGVLTLNGVPSEYTFTVPRYFGGSFSGAGAGSGLASGWLAVLIAPNSTFSALAATNAATFLTVGDSGKIYVTVDSGKTWTARPQSASTATLRGVLLSSDFSPTVTAARKGASTQAPTAFGTAVSCGVGGTILRTTDGGTTWNAVSVPTANALLAIDGLKGTALSSGASSKGASTQAPTAFGTAVSCGVGGTILRTDDGVTWVSASTGTTAELRGIAVANDFAAATASQRSVQSPNGTSGFALRPDEGRASQSASIAQSSTAFGTAVSCGVGGTILRSIDGGASWSAVASPTVNTLNAVDWFGNSSVAARSEEEQGSQAFGTAISCGVGGTILRSTNGGQNWTQVSSGTTKTLNSVVLIDESTGYVSGEGGTILRTTNAGLNWANMSTGTADTLNAVVVLANGTGIAVGTSGLGYTTASGGVTALDAGDTESDPAPTSPKPTEFALLQNYPNPFNPATTIRYSLAEAGSVSLKVYDMLGREVAALVNARQAVGQYTVRFDASRLSTGVYFYRLTTNSAGSQSGTARQTVQTKKMLLVK